MCIPMLLFSLISVHLRCLLYQTQISLFRAPYHLVNPRHILAILATCGKDGKDHLSLIKRVCVILIIFTAIYTDSIQLNQMIKFSGYSSVSYFKTFGNLCSAKCALFFQYQNNLTFSIVNACPYIFKSLYSFTCNIT